ncbi:Nif3-like dinuclear metal center hexameric protein [Corynebacterium antarcticum]|uniref:Nif3-like dinuclear metal center hexameric protein n=1 Tax=Corynebacterium antarcticum TaxID=2800405 RepID=UPI00200625CA|nr:Nif3-like dinuclear metal center hexameric protein [Corynebacterium antarcticum]MCK7660022.1 Nif3-like dinuclear metal center hexameric protein [Corynebacterium antarcticum]
MTSTVAEIRRIMDTAYPPYLAESWDSVGLICGDPDAPVDRVVFALDCTDEVARAAVDAGADMLIVHHPLLLRGVDSVAADTPKGRVLHTLIRGGVALFAAHTNADSARPGVNDALAETIGITPDRAVAPKHGAGPDKWGVHIPAPDAETVKQALFDAGAGAIGDYRECSFQFPGKGQFRPVDGANPTLGSVGELEHVDEVRVEFVAPRSRRGAITAALRAAHPYEEPAFDITTTEDAGDPDTAPGLGRIGDLPEPMRFADFVQQVADRLPVTEWGVRAAGDPDRMVRRVAVCSGSGDSFLDTVAAMGDIDVFLTSDLRHHPVDEHLRAGGPAVIDTAHWASESPWCARAAELIADEAGVDTRVLDIRTDPWTISRHARDEG